MEPSSPQNVTIEVQNTQGVVSSPPSFNAIDPTERPNQFRALFLKNASLQKRRKWTNCCQLCLPITMIVIIGAINVILGNYIKNNTVDTTGEITRESIYPMSFFAREFNYYMFVDQTGQMGYSTQSGNTSGLIGNVPRFSTDPENPNQTLPFFIQFDSEEVMRSFILKQKDNMYYESLYNQYAKPSRLINSTEASASAVFKTANIKDLIFDYDVSFEEETSYSTLSGGVNVAYGVSPVSSFMTYLHNGILLSITNKSLFIDASVQPLPFRKLKDNFDLSGYLAAILLPFALSFLLPVFVYNLVQEKQDKLIEMMKMAGVTMTAYYAVTYLFNFVIYLLVAILVIVIGLIFQLPFFLHTTGALTFLMFLGWGLNQVSFSFLLSTFFSKSRTSTIISYLLVILSIMAGLITESTVWSYKDPNPAYFIWPPFAFYHYLWSVGQTCGLICPQVKDMGPSSQYAKIILVLWIEAVLFLLLAAYLEQVLPREYGVRKSPFFPITDLYKFIFKKKSAEEEEGEEINDDLELHTYRSSSSKAEVDSNNLGGLIEDPDVAEERSKVDKMTKSDAMTYPVLIKDLNKVYGPKIAVVKLCLSLNKNETFGLLGPNGAGKTTTISMCTGLYMPTKGTAYISGYDIRSEMDNVHQNTGVCPQFDILWDLLTTKETLLFYCRVKGVSKDKEEEAALQCLEQVGLSAASEKLVSELSGGMKRRLSVAVSLVGNPKVIFLDEPTTGLDPDSRRQLWNVLLQVKLGKCMVLTTHSMEEADVLCDRIGIMSQGSLKVVGSNVRLKNKYGEGYSLKLNFDPKDTEQLLEYVKRISPDAHLVEDFPGNYTYQISSQNFVMSELLSELINSKNELIKDWGLSQTTLEDVFLNIVKNDEHGSKP